MISSVGTPRSLQGLVGRRVTLPGHFAEPVTIEDARPLGSGAELRVRLASGELDEAVLADEDLGPLLESEPQTHTARAPADPEKLRLLVESTRIRLAYAYVRQFAVSLSGIRALPHPIEAVYRQMLPQPRLRFLLADDPGAGKTIMAGLLVKELNDLSPGHSRIVRRIEHHLAEHPLPGGASIINHYQPARYLVENVGSLAGELAGVELDRFQQAFDALNALLPVTA